MMRAYAKMVYLRDLIPEEKVSDYYHKCMELARSQMRHGRNIQHKCPLLPVYGRQ